MMVKVCRGSLSLPYRSKHTSRDSIGCIALDVVVRVSLYPTTMPIFLLQPLLIAALFAAHSDNIADKTDRRRHRTSASAYCREYLLARFLSTSRYMITTAL